MYELKVENMSCGGCVRGITGSVQAVDSQAKVEVNLQTRTVRVEGGASLDAIATAIADAGYPVTASAAV